MEVIQSFTIDHTCLKPGIYISRQDKGFTTFDIRITEPNKEPAVAPAAPGGPACRPACASPRRGPGR